MDLKTLECQLAISQLHRYLNGGTISDEALEALEAHIAGCKTCQEVIAKHQADPSTTTEFTHAVIEEPAPQVSPTAASPISRLILSKLPKNTKPLVLSTTLALVLVAMSTIAKDPTMVFGDKATDIPKKNVVAQTPTSSPTAIEIERRRFTEQPKTAAPPKPVVASAVVTKMPVTAAPKKAQAKPATKPTPKPRVVRAKAKPVQKRTPRPNPTPRKATTAAKPRPTGIVVYDSTGKRIK